MRRLLKQRFRFYRFYYSVFATCSLIFVLYFQLTITSIPVFDFHPVLKVAAFISGISGLVIMFGCMKKYLLVIAGIKAFTRNNNSPAVLQTGGLHRYTRHPLYFGTLILIWSLFLLYPLWSNLIACSVVSIYTLAGIRIEERKLLAEFGEQYRIYSQQVPMLIPRFAWRTKIGQSVPRTG